jgi:TRAP-type mannitol/chloroaromatic compound transport system permease small subunit
MEAESTEARSRFCDLLDGFIKGIGHTVMWCNGILIFVIILQVILRYGFGAGKVVLEELQWHLYAVGIMVGASYAQVMDSHIRADIIHTLLSDKWKKRWDLFGTIFLLIPLILVVFLQSFDFVASSFRVNEHSDAPMGLPWRWAIKSVIPISFGLLLIATISRLVRLVLSLREISRKESSRGAVAHADQ